MNAEFLLQKIKHEFPAFQGKRHRFLTNGWDHAVVILDDDMIFRAPKKVAENPRNELYDETRLLRYLKNKVNVGIPEYISISKDRSLAGYKMLSGRELTASRFRHLAIPEKELFAEQLADFLTTLHRTAPKAIIPFNVKTENALKNHATLARKTRRYLLPRLKGSEMRLIDAYLDELRAALGQTPSQALIHNDLTGEHLLWDRKGKKVNIIDFGDRAWGDPASDFAGLWEFGSALTNRVHELYHGKQDEKLLYRSQLYFKRIPLYLMIDSFEGYPCTFTEGYKMFRQRFMIKTQ